MLQSCVALNIVVANRPVQHHLQKCFMYWSWGEISVAFLKLLYAIWTFRLFINDSSCYVRVFRKCECAKRFICHYGPQAMKFEPAPIIRPKCFDPLVTVLTGFHCRDHNPIMALDCSYKLAKWNHFVYFCFLVELYSTTKDPRPQMIPGKWSPDRNWSPRFSTASDPQGRPQMIS